MSDLSIEMSRLNAIYSGGAVVMPGVPILMGGTDDPTLIRALLEVETWLALSGEFYMKEAWALLTGDIKTEGLGGTFITEKFRHDMPSSLIRPRYRCSWVSGGWASPSGALPATPSLEEKIVRAIVLELNSVYKMGLGTSPIHDRSDEESSASPLKILMVGGSHAIREGQALAGMGI